MGQGRTTVATSRPLRSVNVEVPSRGRQHRVRGSAAKPDIETRSMGSSKRSSVAGSWPAAAWYHGDGMACRAAASAAGKWGGPRAETKQMHALVKVSRSSPTSMPMSLSSEEEAASMRPVTNYRMKNMRKMLSNLMHPTSLRKNVHIRIS